MSNQPLRELLQRESIQQRCESVYETFGMLTLTVSKENLLALCHLLKHDSVLQFNFLSDICGVDHYPQRPRLETVYHLYSIPFKYRLRIKCRFEWMSCPRRWCRCGRPPTGMSGRPMTCTGLRLSGTRIYDVFICGKAMTDTR